MDPASSIPAYSIVPGAGFAVGSIIGVTTGLSWFLTQKVITVRWLTYGVIGSVIVLLFWAFMTGLMVLIGAQINAVFWRKLERKLAGRAVRTTKKRSRKHLVESPGDE